MRFMTGCRQSGSWLAGFAIALCATPMARATLIASDSFLTTATATTGNYTQGNINGQTATNGTFGYYTGATTSNQVAGWQSGSSVVQASTTALSHPLTVNAPTGTPDGSMFAAGNANNRLQYRDFTTISHPTGTTYYFSTLLSESVTSYTGTAMAGVGLSRPAGANATVPGAGFGVGFRDGAMTFFFMNGTGTNLTNSGSLALLASPTASQTYLAEVAATVTGATASYNVKVYDSSGTLVNGAGGQTVGGGVLDPATDLGSFQAYLTSNFSSGSPSQIFYDEFRFGTAEADVIVPEPAAALALCGLAVASLATRRRRRVG